MIVPFRFIAQSHHTPHHTPPTPPSAYRSPSSFPLGTSCALTLMLFSLSSTFHVVKHLRCLLIIILYFFLSIKPQLEYDVSAFNIRFIYQPRIELLSSETNNRYRLEGNTVVWYPGRKMDGPKLRKKEGWHRPEGVKGIAEGRETEDTRGAPNFDWWGTKRKKQEGKSLVNPSFLSRQGQPPFFVPVAYLIVSLGQRHFSCLQMVEVSPREPLRNRMNCFGPGGRMDWWNRWIVGLWLKLDEVLMSVVSCSSVSRIGGWVSHKYLSNLHVIRAWFPMLMCSINLTICEFIFYSLFHSNHFVDQRPAHLNIARPICYPSQERRRGDPWMNSFAKSEKWLPGGIEDAQ